MPVNEGEVKIREKAGMLLLSVRVQPGATNDQIVGSYQWSAELPPPRETVPIDTFWSFWPTP